jgi:predicted alpha/beta hydrolase family esterase
MVLMSTYQICLPSGIRKCNAVLDHTILRPETILIVGHSLGVMMTLNWMARMTKHSRLQFPGLVSVAGNVTNVGFDEITQHFPAASRNEVARPNELWKVTAPLQ